MASRTRRRRRQRRRGLAPLVVPALAAALSIFLAMHYAVDWGKGAGNPTALRQDGVALAEVMPAPLVVDAPATPLSVGDPTVLAPSIPNRAPTAIPTTLAR